MFWKRVISAIIFAVLVVLVIQKGGLWGFLSIVSIIVIIGTIEFFELAIPKRNRPFLIITILLNLLLCFSPLRSYWINANLILCLAVILPFIYEIIIRRPNLALQNLSSTALCVLYVGWIFGYHLILLRQMTDGKEIIYLLVSIAWSSDIGAYLVGRKIGKHKVIVAISPKKSIEGYIAGLIFGTGASIGICYWLLPSINLTNAIIIGLIMTIIGQIGDLAESILKRSANVKDSGRIMPGHGGILDRCDSIIFMTPALYYYLSYILKIGS
ncbi:MAG: phosphatidate cytidylyltransferase [Candidatus Poribacteria bacterium]